MVVMLFTGTKKVSAMFEKTRRGLSNMRVPLDMTDKYMQNQIQRNFTASGSVLDSGWKPLSPAYSSQKAKKYPGKGILERTGEMRKNFAGINTGKILVISNKTPYFKYHQSDRLRSKIPRRVMLSLPTQQITAIIAIFNRYLKKIT